MLLLSKAQCSVALRKVVEVTARAVIIPGEQFCLLENRIDLGGRTWFVRLEVKTNTKAIGKAARTCCRELAPKPELYISNVL